MEVSKWVVRVLAVLALISSSCVAVRDGDCADGLDNDGDGLVDSIDPGCALNSGLEAPDPPDCADGQDDDGDGLVDEFDWGCDGPEDTDESDPVRQCNDGLDNDGDGLIDGEDPGCENPVDDIEKEIPACGDGVDNDGDGLVDYPGDPGCDSVTDPSEDSPGPAAACDDGVDNDSDGLIDYPEDPGCSSSADSDEDNTIYGACGDTVPMADLSTSLRSQGHSNGPSTSTLVSGECGGYGGEHAFTYTVTETDRALEVSTDDPETTMDTVVYVRTACTDASTELACDDDAGTQPGTSTVVVANAAPGDYVIVVDRKGPSSTGTFHVSVTERIGLGGTCEVGSAQAQCASGLLCRAAIAGADTTCELPVCSDGNDNDGDGTTDYPDEPGCTSPDDGDETDPDPAPLCSDGNDNDEDGLSDYPEDPGCTSAADNVELDECYPGAPVGNFVWDGGVTGDTSTMGSTTADGSCGGSGDRPEQIFLWEADREYESVTFSLSHDETSYDTVLYVRRGICDDETAQEVCDDDGGDGTKSEATFAPQVGELYFVFVDSFSTSGGAFKLSASATLGEGAVCDPADSTRICASGLACQDGSCVSE